MESGTSKQNEEQGQKGAKSIAESTLRTQMTPHDGTSDDPSEATAPSLDKKLVGVPPLAEQVEEIISLASEPMQEGDVGYVVSTKWLGKAQVMAEKGVTDDGELGPLDNTGLNVILDPTMATLKDEKDQEYVPLKPGLQIKEDYEILPRSAWEKLIAWHGMAKGSPVIVRYCHNTSQNEFLENFQYEVYPPIFTIYKLPNTPPNAGNASNPSPVRLLASRHEPFHKFLRRAKKTSGIARETNVRVWKLMGSVAPASTAQPGVLTPADSRSASPQPSINVPLDLGKNLSINVEAFVALQEGSQRELIDIKDESRLPKPEDDSNLGEVGLGQEGILVMEEQVGGPAGGDWVSTVATSRTKSGALIKGFKSADGSLQPGPTSSGRSSPAPSILTRGRSGKGRAKGTVGLGNLGNTCYMNSALQCVRACQELTEYFLHDLYKRELNPTNPLGNHGDVAKAYAALLKEIYRNENSSSFSPRQFRQIIGKYNPQFSGYQQQDSQEFVLFLLDGLQEDLNRITKKPYIEKPDSTDEMVHDHEALVKFAEENWRIYKARNDSVITDLFAGMYKSTLRCPVCEKVSIIFDPYNNLTLQLPVEDTWAKQIVFFPLHARPVHITVEVNKTGTIQDVRAFVSRKVGVDKEKLVFAEIYNKTFYQLFSDGDSVHDIRDGDTVAAYEVDAKPTNLTIQESKKNRFTYYSRSKIDDDSDSGDDPQHSECILVPVVHRHQTGARVNSKSTFGLPGFITLTQDEARSYETILRKVWNRVTTMTTYPFLDKFSDGTDTEDSDMVVMSTEDADSGSSEGKVHTSSVEGEDGIVDVSMRDNDESLQEEGAVPRIAYPPMAPIHKDIHPTLAAGRRLPEELEKKFTVAIYRDGNDKRVPVGLSVPSDSKHWKTLKACRAKQKSDLIKKQKQKAKADSSKKLNLKKAIQTGGSTSESEDELTSLPPAALSVRGQTASPRPSADGSGDESDEEGIPPVQEATTAIPNGQGKLHNGPLVIYETDTEPDQAEPPAIPDRRYVTNEVSPEPLVSLGCGLTVDWNEDYDDFFGGGEEDRESGMPTWDSMMTLPDPELDQKRLRRSQRKKQGVTLDECLDEFGKTEVLSENDAWYCPRCKEHRRAEKTFELWKLPDILVIHLKRFAVQGRLRDKLDVLVQFPIEGLDMTERMKGKGSDGRELIYDLFAVDNHYGGLGGGHYTAYAKNFVDESWYYFDDSMTSKRNAEASITGAAYLLFYRRRNGGQHLGGPNFDKVYAQVESSSTTADSESGSRSDSPNAFSGEGRRLGGSSRNGSSSAYRGAGAVRQAGGGGRRAESEEESEEEAAPNRGTQARRAANSRANSDLDEGYGGADDELPSYEQSEVVPYGPATSWNGAVFSWPDEAHSEKTLADDDADVSSTGAVNDDEERGSLPSPAFLGTPEPMDEDELPILGDVAGATSKHRPAPSPEPAELRIEGIEHEKTTKHDDDVKMD